DVCYRGEPATGAVVALAVGPLGGGVGVRRADRLGVLPSGPGKGASGDAGCSLSQRRWRLAAHTGADLAGNGWSGNRRGGLVDRHPSRHPFRSGLCCCNGSLAAAAGTGHPGAASAGWCTPASGALAPAAVAATRAGWAAATGLAVAVG